MAEETFKSGPIIALYYKRMSLFKYSTLLAIFVTLGLIVWSFQDPVCLNSSVVKKIDLESSAGLYSLWSCGYQNSATESDLPLATKSSYFKIQSEITQFEIFKQQVDPSYSPRRNIKILLSKPQKFEWRGLQLDLGIDFFETAFGFRRALVQAWLQDFLKPAVRQNKVLFDTLTDIYVLMIWAKPDFEMGRSRWLDDVMTEESLCRSSWRPIERQMFCEDLHLASHTLRGQIRSLEEVSSWSLRPLLVKDFWNGYLKLSGFEKLQYSKDFSYNLSVLSDAFQIPFVTDLTSLANAYKVVSGKIGIRARSTAIDFYVVSTKKQFNIFQYDDLINAALEFPDTNILIRNHDSFYVLPGLTRVRVGYAQPEVNQQAIVSCEAPRLDNVLAQNVKSQRVLYVQDCDSLSQIKLVDFLIYGVEAFSESNKSNFMVFHIPSIRIAKEIWKLDTRKILGVKGPEVSPDLKARLFGWSNIKPATLYKMNAALPIVEWLKWDDIKN